MLSQHSIWSFCGLVLYTEALSRSKCGRRGSRVWRCMPGHHSNRYFCGLVLYSEAFSRNKCGRGSGFCCCMPGQRSNRSFCNRSLETESFSRNRCEFGCRTPNQHSKRSFRSFSSESVSRSRCEFGCCMVCHHTQGLSGLEVVLTGAWLCWLKHTNCITTSSQRH